MIAEHDDRGAAEGFHEAQHVERARAAVDEIADEPELVRGGVDFQDVEQPGELVVAALDVTDGVDGHPRAGLVQDARHREPEGGDRRRE